MKPKIGMIVLYNHPGSACGRYPPSQSPAIIQHVEDNGSVRLFIFGPKGQHMDDDIFEGPYACNFEFIKEEFRKEEIEKEKE